MFLSRKYYRASQLRECLINLSVSKSDPEPGQGGRSGDSGWVWRSSPRTDVLQHHTGWDSGSRTRWWPQGVGRAGFCPLRAPKTSLHGAKIQNEALTPWYQGLLPGHIVVMALGCTLVGQVGRNLTPKRHPGTLSETQPWVSCIQRSFSCQHMPYPKNPPEQPKPGWCRAAPSTAYPHPA